MKVQDVVIGLDVVKEPFPTISRKEIEEVRINECTGITFETRENEGRYAGCSELCVVVWHDAKKEQIAYPVSQIAYIRLENDLLSEFLEGLALSKAFEEESGTE